MHKATLKLPSFEYVNSRLTYDLETGELSWKPKSESEEPRLRERNRWNSRWAGKRAGTETTSNDGSYKRLRVRLQDHAYPVHSIAWLLVTGSPPEDELDHINGNGLDNRWCNLRDVNHSVNMQNKKKYKSNSSGVTGVQYYPQTKRWKAGFQVNNKVVRLGYFSSFDKAVEAIEAARKPYGFTETHGVRA